MAAVMYNACTSQSFFVMIDQRCFIALAYSDGTTFQILAMHATEESAMN